MEKIYYVGDAHMCKIAIVEAKNGADYQTSPVGFMACQIKNNEWEDLQTGTPMLTWQHPLMIGDYCITEIKENIADVIGKRYMTETELNNMLGLAEQYSKDENKQKGE